MATGGLSTEMNLEELFARRRFKSANFLLQHINKKFISLDDSDTKKYGEEFRKVLGWIIEKMKQTDECFNACYERIFFAGSYWDGLKVATPNEFDVDLVIKLPLKYHKLQIQDSSIPGFVKVKAENSQSIVRKNKNRKQLHNKEMVNCNKQTPNYGKRLLRKLLNSDGYLMQSEFRKWMESVVNKALNSFQKVEPNRWILSDVSAPGCIYLAKLKKSGPALTLNITLNDGVVIDIDIVPVIEFKYPIWPNVAKSLERYGQQSPTWYVVPKPKKNSSNLKSSEICWRMAFHQQERKILRHYRRGIMKPVCRLLKKLRDRLELSKLSSYYIKTLVLWETEKKSRNSEFFYNTLCYLFIHMLRVLRDALQNRKISFFWDERCNLLDGFSEVEMENCFGRIKNVLYHILNEIETDHFVLARWLLTDEEYDTLRDEIDEDGSKDI